MKNNPFYSLVRTIGYLLLGQLHFVKQSIGKTYKMEDGKNFTVFRHAKLQRRLPGNQRAIFKVRFYLANMTPEKNIHFSRIPIPFFIGLPGFRGKLWMIDKREGYFQGLYEWNSQEDAENYANSFAMRFMKKRSVPGSTSYEIIPNQCLIKYVDSLEEII